MKSPLHFVLFGIGSPLAVEYVESCARRGDKIAAGITNHLCPHVLGDEIPVFSSTDLPSDLRTLPCLVPLFTPSNRMSAAMEAVSIGFGFTASLVDPTAIAPRDLVIGNGSFINAGAIIGAAATLGEHVVVNRGASIGHHARIDNFVSLGPGCILAGNANVGRGAMIGAGAIILPGITIGEGAIVGAGAVVAKDLAAGAKALGVAAQPSFKTRNEAS